MANPAAATDGCQALSIKLSSRLASPGKSAASAGFADEKAIEGLLKYAAYVYRANRGDTGAADVAVV
jgi:hypothetical protein